MNHENNNDDVHRFITVLRNKNCPFSFHGDFNGAKYPIARLVQNIFVFKISIISEFDASTVFSADNIALNYNAFKKLLKYFAK